MYGSRRRKNPCNDNITNADGSTASPLIRIQPDRKTRLPHQPTVSSKPNPPVPGAHRHKWLAPRRQAQEKQSTPTQTLLHRQTQTPCTHLLLRATSPPGAGNPRPAHVRPCRTTGITIVIVRARTTRPRRRAPRPRPAATRSSPAPTTAPRGATAVSTPRWRSSVALLLLLLRRRRPR
jgi:hypothetical protein